MVTSFYYLPFFLISLLFSFFLHPLFSFSPILTSLSTYFSLSPSYSPFFNTFIFSLLVFLFPLHIPLCSSSCLSTCFSSVLFFFTFVLLLLCCCVSPPSISFWFPLSLPRCVSFPPVSQCSFCSALSSTASCLPLLTAEYPGWRGGSPEQQGSPAAGGPQTAAWRLRRQRTEGKGLLPTTISSCNTVNSQ